MIDKAGDELLARLTETAGKERIEILNELAGMYGNIPPLERIQYAEQAVHLADKFHDKKSKADAFNNLGIACNNLGDSSESISYFLSALRMMEELDDKTGIAASFTNLGQAYYYLENYEKALDFFQKALNLREESGDRREISQALILVGNVKAKTEIYNDALDFYSRARIIKEEINDTLGLSQIYNNLGNVYLALEQYDKSLEYRLKALKIDRKLGDRYEIANSIYNLAELLLIVGEPDEAYPYLLKTDEIAEDICNKGLIRDCSQSYSLYYELKGDYQQALKYQREYSEINRSIFTEELSEKVAEMQTKYETEELEKAVEERTKALQQKIHELKSAQEALRISNEKYRSVIENSMDAIVIVRTNGKIEFSNPTASQLIGYTNEEFIGRNILNYVVSEFRESILERMSHDKEEETESCIYKISISRKDGTCLPVEVNSAIINFEGDTAYLLFLRDISTREILEEQLLQSQKMEAVGQLAGGVAHDFNNLLQVISGYTEIAREILEADNPVQDDLYEIAVACERAVTLVRRLLAFSRRQVINQKKLELNSVIAEHLKMLKRVISEDIQLDFHPGDNLDPLYADRGMIEQILMNLCLNARNAMPDGGRIIVETDNFNADEEFRSVHSWAESGRYILFSISDTGCGMNNDTLKHIFEPFFSTRHDEGGTGLGLSTVYGIVKQHKGMITAYSEPEEGTTFRIYLPVSEKGMDDGEIIADRISAEGGSETILFAEDDEKICSYSKRILEEAGYTVFTVKDGIEAVEFFNANSDRIDIVILDVVMPNLDGYRAERLIHDIRPGIPVLFISGYSGKKLSKESDNSENVIPLLVKPYARTTLLGTIRKALEAGLDTSRDT